MKKRIFAALLAACMALAMLPAAALAADSGDCGDGVTWTLDSEGVLTISGKGAMEDYSASDPAPWFDRRGEIQTVAVSSGVTYVGGYAFDGCTALTGVTISRTVSAIGDGAFNQCTGLSTVRLPGSITAIGAGAFRGCTGLSSLTIPESVLVIEPETFSNCTGLTRMVIPEGILFVGDGAFEGCTGLTGVSIPRSVETIGARAFSGCIGLTSVSVPNSVATVGDSAFAGCTGLTSLTFTNNGSFPSYLTEIGANAFSGCSGLTEVTIPGGVAVIRESVFGDCSGLTNVTLSKGVGEIENGAFDRCTALESVTIPASVTKIGDLAFDGCDALADVYYGGSQEDWGSATGGSAALLRAVIHCSDGDIGSHYDAPPDVDISVAAKFTDVDVSDPENWYALPVAWAVVNGITQGTSETEFSPEDNCTRAQIVTFLYRAAGQPDVDRSGAAKFIDVDLNDYYAPAVAWAMEQGITVGTSDTEFSPDDDCTRAQIVTFLWRYEGEPEAPAANVFTDVAAGEYYAAAVAWAVENNITVGTTATTFAPEEYCTRAQIVTFLYRDIVNKT